MGYEIRIDLYDVKVRRDELEAVTQAIAAVAGGWRSPLDGGLNNELRPIFCFR